MQINKEDLAMLRNLQADAFRYFENEYDSNSGLIADKDDGKSPSSISVCGMALTCFIVAIHNKWITRQHGIDRILTMLRFIANGEQSRDRAATGFKGFYFHFLDMHTGRRAWNSELSTIDSALFIAGVLSCETYFDADDEKENEIRMLADKLYQRMDWQWALNRKWSLSHGWKPGRGFLKYRWDDGYSEAQLMYILALAAPEFAIPADSYQQWTKKFQLSRIKEHEYLYAGPLFIHQFSHLWLPLQGLYDDFNRRAGIDYFENSRRATLLHRDYAIENPLNLEHCNAYCWGLTASDGPGRKTRKVNGKKLSFFGYKARGAPFGPDDGTLSPWAMAASLPFAPEVVIPSLNYVINHLDLEPQNRYGLDASFNPAYPEKKENEFGWISPYSFGLNQAPTIIAIENYLSGLIWDLMKRNKHVVTGLKKAGFTGGWLEEKK